MTDAMATTVLVANGPLSPEAEGLLREAVASAGWVIAIDGGAHHLARLGLPAHFVTGDGDSLSEADRAGWARRGATVVPTPDQNYTDLDKALSFAREILGATRLRVFAATGGRLDHIYSVLSALVKHSAGADARLVDEWGETWCLLPGGDQTLAGADLPGRTLSLITLGPCAGVTLEGVEWPLGGEALAPGVRDGTLNRVVAEKVTLSVAAGTLLVMLHHACPPQ